MSINRLFIYDKETNSAVCIAKGYGTGWLTYGDSSYQNEFYNNAEELTGEIDSTRFTLKTEIDLPGDVKIYWAKREEVEAC